MPQHPDPKPRAHPFRALRPSAPPSHQPDHQPSDQHRPSDQASPPRGSPPPGPRYAELSVTSNFTFLTGASHPEECVERAASLGHSAAAIADTNSLAGVVRAHVAATQAGIPLAVGCRVVTSRHQDTEAQRHEGGSDRATKRRSDEGEGRQEGTELLVYPTTRAAYGGLCRLLTLGKRRAPKGECELSLHDVLDHAEGLLAVYIPPRVLDERCVETIAGLRARFDDDRLSIAVWRDFGPDDDERVRQVRALASHTGVPLAAVNHARYHAPERRPLHDVVTCIRHGTTIEHAGRALLPHAERHLKPAAEMERLLAECPGACARGAEVALRASAFSLDELRYEYPAARCPPGVGEGEHLRAQTLAGARRRYGGDVPERVRTLIDYELALIAELRYEAYFLTCQEIVDFARGRGILCQGRGGAANSAVCYCLGLTEVDPSKFQLLFERFISRARNEPPDIDIDFEHERREEVIQHIYSTYGRDRAALTAEVITYRARSAVREVAKAMGLSLDRGDALAKNLDRWAGRVDAEGVREIGLNPGDATLRRVLKLTNELVGFPRHLSQHVGGFVITRGPLNELVPIENAAMEDRTVIEWDKDDIDALGLLKVDVLGLGMLTCVRKALEMVGEETERRRDGETKWGGGQWWEGVGGGGGWCGVEDAGLGRMCTLGDGGLRHGGREDVSGSGGMAEGHGACACGVHGDEHDAGHGAIRADEPDEASGGVDSLEYCRGFRAGEPAGPCEVSSCRSGLAQRACDAGGAGDCSRHAARRHGGERTPGRDGSCAPSADHEPVEQVASDNGLDSAPNGALDGVPNGAATIGGTSSLRLSVSSSPDSVLAFYRSIAGDPSDPAVYEMICRADTVGVFQIESRAQMSMLPRLRPREFYDLVIEVAIVRPGPIQGKMVHPYLRRRNGEESVHFPSAEIEEVLGRTLGVPLFQEQAMRLAIVAAGFTPDEADQLRRAMAAWRRKSDALFRFGERIIEGMLGKGYTREFAERCFEQIKGFSEYGFPESHAASFAILVYVSSWLKRYHPAAFAAALINSQPMGFYAPAQIVRDAREHGVEVREIDVNRSGWECGLESRHEGSKARRHEEGKDGETESRDREAQRHRDEARDEVREMDMTERQGGDGVAEWGGRGPALRLGMRLVKGLGEDDARRVEAAGREHGPFRSVDDLWRVSGVSVRGLRALARADAFGSMGLDRRAALWAIRSLRDERLPLFEQAADSEAEREGLDALPPVPADRVILHDYDATGLSLKAHPLSMLRDGLARDGVVEAGDLRDAARTPSGERACVAGLVLCRQRPSTASGVVFVTLEDETGIANLIIWPKVYERFRRVIRLSSVLLARGKVEREGLVVHVHADEFESLDARVPGLGSQSRDFH